MLAQVALATKAYFHSAAMSLSATVTIPRLNKSITVPTGLFINNEFVASVDSKEVIQYVELFRR